MKTTTGKINRLRVYCTTQGTQSVFIITTIRLRVYRTTQGTQSVFIITTNGLRVYCITQRTQSVFIITTNRLRMHRTTQGTQYNNNYKWGIIFKNCNLLYYIPIPCKILYFNYIPKKIGEDILTLATAWRSLDIKLSEISQIQRDKCSMIPFMQGY